MPRLPKSDKAERKRIKLYHDTVAAVEQLAGGGIATGQTIARLASNESPLARLKRLSRLNTWEFTAATDVVVGYYVSAGFAKPPDDPDMGRNVLKPDAAERIAIGQIDARHSDIVEKYRQWRADLDGHPALAAAVAMLFDERSARQIDADWGKRKGTAMKMLVIALRHMAALRGNTPRASRGWRLPERNMILEDAMQLARLVRRGVDSRGQR